MERRIKNGFISMLHRQKTAYCIFVAEQVGET